MENIEGIENIENEEIIENIDNEFSEAVSFLESKRDRIIGIL